MAETLKVEKSRFRIKLKELGLNENQLEEIIALFDEKGRHMDIIVFVTNVERYGVPRETVYSFLRGVGVDDPTLINVFARADLRKAGLDENKIQEVVLT